MIKPRLDGQIDVWIQRCREVYHMCEQIHYDVRAFSTRLRKSIGAIDICYKCRRHGSPFFGYVDRSGRCAICGRQSDSHGSKESCA